MANKFVPIIPNLFPIYSLIQKVVKFIFMGLVNRTGFLQSHLLRSPSAGRFEKSNFNPSINSPVLFTDFCFDVLFKVK
jgi:hypothetical protein